jgi:hypothetical protein
MDRMEVSLRLPRRRAGDAQAFLRRAFVDGAGEFRGRNHVVGALDGVAGGGRGHGGDTRWRCTLAATRRILGHYGWRPAAGVVEDRLALGNARGRVPDHRRMHWQAPVRVDARTG